MDESGPIDDQIREAASALTDAASAISSMAASNDQASSFVSVGQVSVGAVIGTIVGGLVAFFVRRSFAKKDERGIAAERRRATAIDRHDRFNSAEVLAARTSAEKFLICHPGQGLADVKSDDVGYNAIWIVAREYELISISIEEDIVDKNLVAKYSFEIFVYWLQHFRFFFQDKSYEIVKRLRYLEDFFKEHPYTKERWDEMEASQRQHINDLIEASGKEKVEFASAPELCSFED